MSLLIKTAFMLAVLAASSLTHARAQNSFPKLDAGSLVSPNIELTSLDKPYTILVYGGVGCSYSKYLIEHLNVLDDCRTRADIILIMDQPADSVIKYMDKVIEKYPTFSNASLGYKLKKKADIFPQLLLFKNGIQIDHITGIREGMLTKTRDRILNNE